MLLPVACIAMIVFTLSVSGHSRSSLDVGINWGIDVDF
jgi:hypothetical protein